MTRRDARQALDGAEGGLLGRRGNPRGLCRVYSRPAAARLLRRAAGLCNAASAAVAPGQDSAAAAAAAASLKAMYGGGEGDADDGDEGDALEDEGDEDMAALDDYLVGSDPSHSPSDYITSTRVSPLERNPGRESYPSRRVVPEPGCLIPVPVRVVSESGCVPIFQFLFDSCESCDASIRVTIMHPRCSPTLCPCRLSIRVTHADSLSLRLSSVEP